jgi:hypothetical protein
VGVERDGVPLLAPERRPRRQFALRCMACAHRSKTTISIGIAKRANDKILRVWQ